MKFHAWYSTEYYTKGEKMRVDLTFMKYFYLYFIVFFFLLNYSLYLQFLHKS